MYLAVDIGGTKTLVAMFSVDGDIVEQIKFATPKEYAQFKIDLASAASSLDTESATQGVVGIRGNIDRDSGMSLMDDVLPWGKSPVRDDCQKIFGCQFIIENDSKLAGLSEAILVLEKFKKVLYITISTGIGSAFIINGKLDPNTQDSEIGKSVYEYDDEIRQFEDVASGKAIVEKYGKLASDLDDPDAWQEISNRLAIGFVNAIAAFTPDVVIVGGGVGSYFPKFEQPLRHAMIKIAPEEISLPPVIQAHRPEEAVIYGCYELAKNYAAKNLT